MGVRLSGMAERGDFFSTATFFWLFWTVFLLAPLSLYSAEGIRCSSTTGVSGSASFNTGETVFLPALTAVDVMGWVVIGTATDASSRGTSAASFAFLVVAFFV